MRNAILKDEDSIENIASEVCCQGAKLLCGKVVSCNAICTRTTQLSSSDSDNAQSFTLVSGKVIVEDSEFGAEMLVPTCQKNFGSSCECGSDYTSNKEHPSVVDSLTVLILALPPDTWSSLNDAKVQQDICGIVSSNKLPDLLQQEVSTISQDIS